MTVDEIKAHHESLNAMKTTQSVKLQMEKKSDAHEHRGFLLKEIEKLNEKLTARDLTITKLQGDIQHFWAEAPKDVQRDVIASQHLD